jgi:acetyl esterase/lipase
MNYRGYFLRVTENLTDLARRQTLSNCLNSSINGKGASKTSALLVIAAFLGSMNCPAQQKAPEVRATVGADGTVHVPAIAIPLSSYMSDDAKQAFLLEKQRMAEWTAEAAGAELQNKSIEQVQQMVDNFWRPKVERAKALYPVNIKEQEMAGVRTDVMEPTEGVPLRNRHRVLISLHGGGYGPLSGGQVRLIEAIPVAGYGKIKVVSVDYRMSPKHKYPAAVEDVIAVYRALLKQYKPENVGIYGCSTGAALTANVIARLQKENLSRPGVIGLFCEGAQKDDQMEGDSWYFAAAMMGERIPAPGEPYPSEPYLEGTEASDPLVAPVVSLEVLSKFPPTLLISGSRDIALSTVLYTHSRLIKAGVEADLHVWDGMWHSFYFDVTLPESKEAYEVMARFFDKHLGQR